MNSPRPASPRTTLGVESLEAREIPVGIGQAISHALSSIAHTVVSQSALIASHLPQLSSSSFQLIPLNGHR